MATEQLVAQELISHVNPVMTSLMAITKVRLATFLHSWFRFLLCCSSWLKTVLAQRTSHASSSLSMQTEIWIFALITYFRYHVTEYCAVIGTHSMVRGNKLLYGPVPDPFPWCRIGSGHARLPEPRFAITQQQKSVLTGSISGRTIISGISYTGSIG